MPRLRRSDPADAGFSRRRCGKGFAYFDVDGRRLTDPAELDRVRALAVPPAWRDTWICPSAAGHIQAVGTDSAGRRQYLYHGEWRRRRDDAKFERMLRFARRLPRLRRAVAADLTAAELTRERVLATVVRLLDLGTFRIGNDEYAEENGTFGLVTLHRDHVRIRGGEVRFDYTGKGGARCVQAVSDPAVTETVRALRRRRDRDRPELFAYRREGAWCDVRSEHVNDYLRTACGLAVTAKDFRTWHGTVLMALELAAAPCPPSRTARMRSVRQAYVTVSEELGNTPAVARASYVDPRVVDLYHDSVSIADLLPRPNGAVRPVERAVIRMLRELS